MTAPGLAAVSAEVARRPPYRTPLRRRDFRLLWIGGTAATVGDQFTFVALAWLALQLTGSPATLGAVLTVAAVPRAGLVLIGGVLADRLSARRVAVTASLARACVVGLLAMLVITHQEQLWEVFVLVFGFGVADGFYAPARATLVPQTVAAHELEAANSLAQIGQSVAALIGPALGGVVVAAFGPGYAFIADAAGFAAVAITSVMLRTSHGAQVPLAAAATIWTDLRHGVRYVFGDPALHALLLVVAAVNVAITGPIDVGLAYLARVHLGGAAALGILLAGFAAGSLAGSLAAGMLGRRALAPLIVLVCATVGIGLPLLGYVHSLPIALVDTAVMGAMGGYVSVAAIAAVQRRIEPRVMGRVMSLFVLASVGTGPISLAAAGFLAQVSLMALFATAGAMVLASGVGSLFSRELRRL